MNCLKQKLQKHRVSRQLLVKGGLEEPWSPPVPEDERLLREDLAWQTHVGKALQAYSASMTCAFQALLKAQQALQDMGLGHADENVTAIAGALLRGLSDADLIVRKAAKELEVPLASHLATLHECAGDVVRAEETAGVLRHYQIKLADLEEEAGKDSGHSKNRASAAERLERNREKLHQAITSFNVAQTRAKDQLQACGARRGKICGLLHGMLSAIREALTESTIGSRPVVASVVFPPGPNPFDDVPATPASRREQTAQAPESQITAKDDEPQWGTAAYRQMGALTATHPLPGDDPVEETADLKSRDALLAVTLLLDMKKTDPGSSVAPPSPSSEHGPVPCATTMIQPQPGRSPGFTGLVEELPPNPNVSFPNPFEEDFRTHGL